MLLTILANDTIIDIKERCWKRVYTPGTYTVDELFFWCRALVLIVELVQRSSDGCISNTELDIMKNSAKR